MVYDFDAVIERHGSGSVKFDLAEKLGYPKDVLPLWVADMDFQAPECVRQALHEAVDHGIFGYSVALEDYYAALRGWFSRRFGWQVQDEWVVVTPGVVFALSTLIRALTKENEAVLVQPPVYYPFFSVVEKNGRKLVESGLIYEKGRYRIDFEDMEKKIVENDVKLYILCSPHNPVCRVWTVEELQRLGAICKKHGVLVISDEIHCDFAFPEHPHTPFLKACPDMADSTVICTAPSKSFNLAGLQVSNIFIPNAKLRQAVEEEISTQGYDEPSRLGAVACKAAYLGGEDWLEACKAYMRENLCFVRAFLAEHLPKIRLVEPEGTYFAWLDCSELGYTKEALDELIIHKAKLWLDSGAIFGACAAQFQRVVLACPRATLEEALHRLKAALDP